MSRRRKARQIQKRSAISTPRQLAVSVLATLAVAAAAPHAALAAVSQVFTVEEDSYVSSATPNTTHGSLSFVKVDADPIRRGYLRFTVSGVSGAVERATLRLYTLTSHASGFQVRFVADNSWDESTLTWNNAPPPATTVTASSGGFSAGTWLSLDVTPLVSGNGTYSFALTTGSSASLQLASKENGATTRPQLVVQLASQASAPEIAAAGDIACDPTSPYFKQGLGDSTHCRQKYTSDLLVGTGLAGVLTLGDNQYENSTYDKYLASFDPSWGRVKDLIHPAPGNHEYADPAGGAAGYFKYFGAAAGDPTKGYYSFDIGTWHVIALNSECAAVGGCGADSPQEVWLHADLAAHPMTCTLAYSHHPRFSSGPHGSHTMMRDLWQTLYDYGADVVLSGHDHTYERFAPQTPSGTSDPARGIRQFVVGTGGKSHYGFPSVQPNSEVRSSGTFGVLRLTLHPTSYEWEFVPEAGKTFRELGSASCH